MDKRELPIGWEHGPLPPNTWGWGAIHILGESGFRLAFCNGDHVELHGSNRRIEPHEILCYNHSLGIGLLK